MPVLAQHALVAHQNGWDEILLIAGPMAIIAGLLVLAKRRVDKIADGQTESNGKSRPNAT